MAGGSACATEGVRVERGAGVAVNCVRLGSGATTVGCKEKSTTVASPSFTSMFSLVTGA